MAYPFANGRLALGLVALALMSTSPLRAADYAPYRPVYVPQPVQPQPEPVLWNSCFVGADAGVWITNARVDSKALDQQTAFPYPYATSKSDAAVRITQPGPSLGLNGGCDSNKGTYVLGWEGNINYTPIDSKGTSSYTDPWSQDVRLNNHVELSLSARVGKAFGDTLVYGKLGVAASDFKYRSRYTAYSLDYVAVSYSGTTIYAPSSNLNTIEADKYRWLFGPKVGFGVEHMLSAEWSVKAEADTTYYNPTRSNFTFNSVYLLNRTPSPFGVWQIPASNKWGYVAQAFVTNLSIGVNRRF